MGNRKKEASRRERQGNTGQGMDNVKVKGENFYRDAKKVKTLSRLKEGKPIRSKDGKIIKAASYQSRDTPVARIEPNRKWFTNSRVISQEALSSFREAVEQTTSDPYSYLLRQNKLPMSLIRDGQGKNGLKQHQAKMAIETEPFNQTFGPKAQRKRVKLGVSSLDDLAQESSRSYDSYLDRLEQARLLSGKSGADGEESDGDFDAGVSATAIEPIFSKGQSKRIWNELYKVIDSSDVLIHVLDARDPLGTRCRAIESYIKSEAPHKHLVFVLNKCDLVPTSIAAQWVRTLSKEYPTLAFHASIKNPFGKGSLINLLRQFSALHSDRKQIQVGLVGYPNVGKSSVINTLRNKAVCTVAPIPGETKVWQYITLMKRIYLIDCPGVVPPSSTDTPQDLLLRGTVRIEKLEHPEQYIEGAMARCKQHHIERTYDIRGYSNATEFLEVLARKGGRLFKGGEPDIDAAAKIFLQDFLRGKLPWFVPPPATEGGSEEGIAGRQGRLGEMGRKRKRSEDEPPEDGEDHVTEYDDEEFKGFDDDDTDSAERSQDEQLDGGSDDDDDEDGVTLVAEESDDEDEDVEKDLALISEALASQRKRRKEE